MSDEWRPLIVFASALVAGGVLSHYAPRWLPPSEPEDPFEARNSKRPVRNLNVPRVGGFAVLVALFFAGVPLPWFALSAALLLGAIDDRWPLSAGLKALGQLVPAALLAWQMGELAGDSGGAVLQTWLWVLPLAWAAQNIVNTWDHADGFVCGLAGIGLPPPVAAAFLGVLPWNLLLRKPTADGSNSSQAESPEAASTARTKTLSERLSTERDPGEAPDEPHLYLGDAGAHLAAILFVWHPIGRWFLVLPALDLLRVVILRLRANHPIWKGDRRHLGHHLQGLGWPPKYVAVAALIPAAPLLGAAGWGVMAALSCGILWACLLWAAQPMSGAERS